MLRYKRLTDQAFLLKKGSDLAAGFDISSPREYTIPARKSVLVSSDIRLYIPEGCYGRLASRSGLSCNYNIDVNAGVIDRDYMGNVGIVLFNNSDNDYHVKRGDRIAQIILEKCLYVNAREITQEEENNEHLVDTLRKDGGFGSTGK